MKFKIKTSDHVYTKFEADQLETLGFSFKDRNEYYNTHYVSSEVLEIEINTIEELISIQNKFGAVMISKDMLIIKCLPDVFDPSINKKEKPKYTIAIDRKDKNSLCYCLSKDSEVLLFNTQINNPIEFWTQINLLSKIFKAEIIEEK